MVEQQVPATDSRQLDGIFRALADPTRRDMLRRLAAGERTITELAEPCAMSFAAASKHVRVLERAGLVRRNVRGRSHYCQLKPGPLGDVHEWLTFYKRYWTERLDALETMLRRDGEE
jgi:DNA-binding transcriptional ArsR family regulator